MGCSLDVKEDGSNLIVTGNKCPRGGVYAQEELRAPKRVVTATCLVTGNSSVTRRIPVKTAVPCPKEKIPALLEDIYKTKAVLPVNAGDTVLANWQGLGIDVIATRTLH
jgi:CxxC motif-containing protein